MIIAIRKESNESIYIDKTIYQNEKFKNIDLTKPPYNYRLITIIDNFADCISSDFNDDLTFNLTKYQNRKTKEFKEIYENLIIYEIRKKYSLNQELAILRQRDSKPDEFNEYNLYVESCKSKIKNSTGGF